MIRKLEKPDMENTYDFYKCGKCGRLITYPESIANISKGSICPCGGLKCSPVNPSWYDFLKPRVWWFWFLRGRGWA